MKWDKQELKTGNWFALWPVLTYENTWAWLEMVYWRARRDQSGGWCYTYWAEKKR